MKTLVVFPGRFQPPHRGHLSVYDYLNSHFDTVFIATTDRQAPVTSPFSFADKVQIWSQMGVPPGKIVKVKSPYNPVEITSEVPDPEHTALVLAVSSKDMQGDGARFKFGKKRDGSPSYLQKFETEKKLLPMTEHAYVLTIPTALFALADSSASSATEIRDRYIAANDADRDRILSDLYGEPSPTIKSTFDSRLAVTERANHLLAEARSCSCPRLESTIARLLRAEARTNGIPFTEDLMTTHLPEK